MFTIAAFYKFTQISESIQQEIKLNTEKLMNDHQVFGTILIAQEGINSTIAGTNDGVTEVLNFLKSITQLSDIEPKLSYAEKIPFAKIKVKIKKEILTFGEENCEPSTAETGKFVNSKEWNNLIAQSDVLTIDVRNDYEVQEGSFKNAVDPKTVNFTDFKEFVATKLDPEKNKKVAMFCTGGIRCEKASSYMLKKGFKEVYQLEGGILKYLEETKEEDSCWQGNCFIFDERRSLNHNLKQSSNLKK